MCIRDRYASSAAFLPQPGFAIYAATKSFVLSYSRALNQELRSRRIYVTAVCPGPVKTEFFDIAESTGVILSLIHILGIKQHGSLQLIRPVIIMGKAAQAGFDSAYNDRHILIRGPYPVSYTHLRDDLLVMWAAVHGLAAMANMKGVQYDSGDWGALTERLLLSKVML